MKIEKLSDKQIRCTLTREDLQERGLRLSELAYGTEKARELFRDMMQQANYMFGFRAENTPLMIEAIPISGGTIVLIVTKVESSDELDPRFSSFAPSVQSDSLEPDHTPSTFEQLMNAIRDAAGKADNVGKTDGDPDRADKEAADQNRRGGLRPQDIKAYQSFLLTHRVYTFPSISAAAKAARRVADGFTGESALYEDGNEHIYYLFVTMKDVHEVDAMQSRLAALTEYGRPFLSPYARMEYVREHGRTILGSNAIQTLSNL